MCCQYAGLWPVFHCAAWLDVSSAFIFLSAVSITPRSSLVQSLSWTTGLPIIHYFWAYHLRISLEKHPLSTQWRCPNYKFSNLQNAQYWLATSVISLIMWSFQEMLIIFCISCIWSIIISGVSFRPIKQTAKHPGLIDSGLHSFVRCLLLWACACSQQKPIAAFLALNQGLVSPSGESQIAELIHYILLTVLTGLMADSQHW